MNTQRLIHTLRVLCLVLLLAGCTSELSDTPVRGEYTRLVLTIDLGNSNGKPAAKAPRMAGFDNEDDKWGIPGENIEELRIIILDGGGNVEYNRQYRLSNTVQTPQYEFKVKKNEDKTIIFLANEGDYMLDNEGLESEAPQSLKSYLDQFAPNTMIDIDSFRKLIIKLKNNSRVADGSNGNNLSLKTPLLISAIYNERIGEDEITERTYDLNRAAVKYSFRIINQSGFTHHLEGLRINRIADREYLFANATYTTNELGHKVIASYSIPGTTTESEYAVTGLDVTLPIGMTEGIQIMDPIYVPEGSPGNSEAQKVSISLDGAPLEVWRDLKWIMPGETEASERPMVDLPRNSHVVVNITITDHGIDFIADVQPYAEIILNPPFGLDRDNDGNIIAKRYPDGTYDIIKGDTTIRKDEDGDEVLKIFADSTLLCKTEVLKDYIHENNVEVDYAYYFEKDKSGGNMVILRQQSTGGTYHGGVDDLMVSTHDHNKNDRPLFVADKTGDFYKVIYDGNGKPSLTKYDTDGAEIIQANGYQFRAVGEMKDYLGTYIVITKDGQEELRHYQTGEKLEWDTGVRKSTSHTKRSTVNISVLLQKMRKTTNTILHVLNKK